LLNRFVVGMNNQDPKKVWKKERAKEMRSHMSWPERKLWAKIHGKTTGTMIHSQKVMFGYILDFWCPDAKLAIEVDGKQHLTASAQKWDATRDAVMSKAGIKTLRFSAKTIEKNLAGVVAMIVGEIAKRKKLFTAVH